MDFKSVCKARLINGEEKPPLYLYIIYIILLYLIDLYKYICYNIKYTRKEVKYNIDGC